MATARFLSMSRIPLHIICLFPVVTAAADCSCKYQGTILPDDFIQTYPVQEPGKWSNYNAINTYGTMCAPWDQVPGTPFYSSCEPGTADYAGSANWCQVPWCYVDPSCSSAFPSDVFNGSTAASFSYAVCGNAPNCYNQPMDAGCPYDPYGENNHRVYKHSCKCKFHGQLLPTDLITNYPADSPGRYKDAVGINNYGTTCAAWDQRPFTPWASEFCPPGSDWCYQYRNWCQVPWCYVDESCPTKIASTVFSGSTTTFYSYDTCLSAPDCYTNSVDPTLWGNLPQGCPWDGKTISWFTSASCETDTEHYGGGYRATYDNTRQLDGHAWHMVDVPYIKCDAAGKALDSNLQSFQGAPGAWKATLHRFDLGTPDILLTFFRNSFQDVTITYNLTDFYGSIVLPNTTVTLVADISRQSRRLDNANVESSSTDASEERAQFDETCESFWLSDGRSPVEIPDSWGEARQEFRSICMIEGVSESSCSDAENKVFDGHPHDFESPFSINQSVCALLFEHLTAMMTAELEPGSIARDLGGVGGSMSPLFSPLRRLKGAGTTGRATRSPGNLRSSYPSGYRSTGYGYSGVGYTSGTRSRMAMYSGVVVVGPFGGPFMYTRHYSRRRGGSSCSYRDAHDQCVEDVSHSQDMLRDDIADSTFIWQDFELPLTLSISRVDGADFDSHRICPPADYCMACFDDPSACPTCASFTDPPNQDLFVTFSDANRDPAEWCYDPKQPQRSMVPWSDCRSGAQCCDDTVTPQRCPAEREWCEDEDDNIVGWIIGLAILVVVICCITGCICRSCHASNKTQDEAEATPPLVLGQGYDTQPVVVQGTAVNMTGTQPGVVDNEDLNPVFVQAAPMPCLMSITIPDGYYAGSQLQVQTPNGQLVQVTVPPGVYPGSQMQVQY